VEEPERTADEPVTPAEPQEHINLFDMKVTHALIFQKTKNPDIQRLIS